MNSLKLICAVFALFMLVFEAAATGQETSIGELDEDVLETALMNACEADNIDMDAPDDLGDCKMFVAAFPRSTTLMMAAACGWTEVSKILISAGVDLEENLEGDTALTLAVSEGHTNICEMLISAGADINKKNKDGYGKTALDIAKEKNRPELVELLERHGASVTEIELVDILEYHGISLSEINKPDEEGNTPLIYAASIGRKDACKILISAGADVNKENKDDYGNTALLIAAQRGYTDICQILISAGADIDKQGINGQTPLIQAIESYGDGHIDTCKILIAAGADINKEGVTGDTALYLSAIFGYTEIVDLLIKEGADVNKVENWHGWTPLMQAAGKGYTEICKLLVSAGADIDKEDNDGQTALLCAVYGHFTEICNFLISSGASIEKASKEIQTAEYEEEIAQYLAELGQQVNN